MTDLTKMDRRALMARAMVLVGASATGVLGSAVRAADFEGLSPARSATLAALSDTIIPKTDTAGALDTDVPARLEAMLGTWASPQTVADFNAVLDEVGALQDSGTNFAQLSAAKRHDLLLAFDAAAFAPTGEEVTANQGSRGVITNPRYARLKELIVTLYFMSQEALSQELVYDHVPGRWDPSIEVTPDTRPWATANI